MAEGETLRAAVEAQARALTAGDLATFASFAEPRALPPLHRTLPLGRIRSFQLGDVSHVSDTHGASEVRFGRARAYVLRGQWERTNLGWKAVALDGRAKRAPMTIWRRLLRRSGGVVSQMRQDLS